MKNTLKVIGTVIGIIVAIYAAPAILSLALSLLTAALTLVAILYLYKGVKYIFNSSDKLKAIK